MPLSEKLSKKIDVLAREIASQVVEKLKPVLEAEARRLCIEYAHEALDAVRTALGDAPVANAVASAESPVVPANSPTMRDCILAVLQDGQARSKREVQNAVAQRANVKSNSVAKAIARLIAAGDIVISGNGAIQLPRN